MNAKGFGYKTTGKWSYAEVVTEMQFHNVEHVKLWNDSKLQGRWHSSRRQTRV